MLKPNVSCLPAGCVFYGYIPFHCSFYTHDPWGNTGWLARRSRVLPQA